jgi:hypothetical protein
MKKRKKRASSHSGVGDEEVYVGEGKPEEKGNGEGSDGDFFNAGEGAAIDALTSRSLLALHPKVDQVRAIQKKIPLGPWHRAPILRSSQAAHQ